MFQETRKEQIINLLKEKKQYKVEDLRLYFKVSLATIHRDLNELEREGRVKKIHGGVLLNIAKDIETQINIRLQSNIKLKKIIAKKTLEFVENEDCIFLDNSTTCYYFAELIAESKFKNIVIVTNSYLIPGLFTNNNNIEIILTGGVLAGKLSCFVGPIAITAIKEFNGNKFFFSTASISLKGELSDLHHYDTNEVKKEMFKRSNESFCLIDSTKFNKIGQSKVFSIMDVDNIITDNECSKEIREEFAKAGKELIIS